MLTGYIGKIGDAIHYEVCGEMKDKGVNYCKDCARCGDDCDGNANEELVAVVRCKDCVGWEANQGLGYKYGVCTLDDSAIKDTVFTHMDYYCADGERRK